MDAWALLLLAVSAAAHAGWNLLGVGGRPSLWFFAAAEGAVALATVPFWPWAGGLLSALGPDALLLLLLSCTCQALYYAALAAAYRREGMAAVYPLVRALPVAGMAVLAGSLGWRPLGMVPGAGVVLVVGGCLVAPLVAGGGLRRLAAGMGGAPVLLAAGSALVFSLLDAHLAGLARHAGGGAGVAALAVGICVGNALGCCALAAALPGEPAAREALTGRWREAVLCGLGAWLSYGTFLAALARVDHPGHAAAVRQLSIPLGVALAMLVRGERPGAWRLAGQAAIIAGALVIALAPR